MDSRERVCLSEAQKTMAKGLTIRRLQRLRQMSWAEVRFRSRQLLRKRWDGFFHSLAGSRLDGDSSLPPHGWQERGRFFFSGEEVPQIVRLLRTRAPEAAEETIEQAEQIIIRRVDLLGYTGLDFGREIDWHADPVHQKRAPRRLWYRIPYLDVAAVGDSKVIWEINRHQHWLTLSKAYWFTGREKYALEVARQFAHWQRENPYPVGINWASSLEVAFRSLAWLWTRELLAPAGCLPESFWRELLVALNRNARFIERNLSIYFSPNTHLLGEAVALFFIGTLCPGLQSASRWRDLGWQILLEQSRMQVRRDGGYFEQSTYYHVYALDLLLHARILAPRNQVRIPPELDRTLLAMLEFLAALSSAGPPPRFGDDDGGRVFNPRRNLAEHLPDPLSTGAVLFGRADFKAAAKTLREETLWLLGSAAAEKFDRMPEISAASHSRAFPETGTYVLASPGLRLVMDAGPLGFGRGGHGHADGLSVWVAADGREWIGDAGTFTYTASQHWRDWFRGTPAHNTLAVDGLDQAIPTEPFAWARFPQTRVEQWVPGVTFDLLIASHDGYLRLPSPVRHRRLVFFLKDRFWLVADMAEGHGKHHLEVNWHLPSLPLEVHRSEKTLMVTVDQGFAVCPLRDPQWAVELGETWWSPCYGVKERSLALRCSARVSLPAQFATLLLPRMAGRLPEVVLERVEESSPGVTALRFYDQYQRHCWVISSGDGSWQIGELAGNGRISYCAQGIDGRFRHVVVCDGSYLAFDDKPLLEAPERSARMEYRWSESEGELCSSDVTPLRVVASRPEHEPLFPLLPEREPARQK